MDFNINIADQYAQWQAHLFDADRIPLVLAALGVTSIIGMITGPLLGNAYPAYWVFLDKVFGLFGDKLDRLHRKRADLLFRGFVFAAFILVFGVLGGKYLEIAANSYGFYGFSHIFLLSALLTSGSVWYALLRFYFAIEKKTVGEGAYFAISRTTRINLNSVDEYGITRVGMALAARSFDKGMVAPAIWFLIGGYPAAFAYASIGALAWRFGKKGFTKGFGETMLALERLLGFIPGLFSAVLITLASGFTPTAKMGSVLKSWIKARQKAPYAQGGFPLTAMAYALDVSLGGPEVDLGGSAHKNAWVGPDRATAKIGHKHLRRAIYINVIAHILFVASLCGAYLWAGRLF